MKDKASVVVILGATGVGKSRLSIDLARKFGGEIINADSMQVYKELDILTNKVPLEERSGIPHHLLGMVNSNEEFTVKSFRDFASLAIDDIVRREKLPIVVGGTNYYIQALVSAYLLDDFLKEIQSGSPRDLNNGLKETEGKRGVISPLEIGGVGDVASSDTSFETDCVLETAVARQQMSNLYEELKKIDEKAAGGIHPNNSRKLNQLIGLYKRTGRKPSDLLDSNCLDKWGAVDSFRYNCCFICLDAEPSVLDRYVEERVDIMMQAGLLREVSEFYAPGADFTQGLHQAIGVLEFSSMFTSIVAQMGDQWSNKSAVEKSTYKQSMEAYLNNIENEEYVKSALEHAVKKMKVNTKRLTRVQRRRLIRLENLFKWNIYRVDVTNVLRNTGSENSKGLANEIWHSEVVCPSVSMVEKFLKEPYQKADRPFDTHELEHDHRRSRERFVCEACSCRVFIGMHQWQEHIRARSHRKRVASAKKVSSAVLNMASKV